MKKNYTLCDYKECPLKEKCARYLEDLDRTKTNHFGTIPYNHEKNECNFCVSDETEEIIRQMLNRN
jgi:hypothetical protein